MRKGSGPALISRAFAEGVLGYGLFWWWRGSPALVRANRA